MNEGRYKARIGDHGLGSSKSGLVEFDCEYILFQFLDGNEWVDCEEERITGYHYLEKSGGALNDFTINALKDALGWDGRDIIWLQDADLTQTVVSVTLGMEEYNGKSRMKVQFVNPENFNGGRVSRADANELKSLQSRLGSKLRALSGGTPTPTPKPATQSPKPPPARKTVAKPTATEEQAWEHFLSQVPQNWTEDQANKEWYRILEDLVVGKKPDAFTSEDWGVVKEKCGNHILPV